MHSMIETSLRILREDMASLAALSRSTPVFRLARQLQWRQVHSAGRQLEDEISFVERAKIAGANGLLGKFTSRGGFDACVRGLNIERIEDGWVGVVCQYWLWQC